MAKGKRRRRKSSKRIRAGRSIYKKGLKSYMTSPKYAAKRRAAARKAARTRLAKRKARTRNAYDRKRRLKRRYGVKKNFVAAEKLRVRRVKRRRKAKSHRHRWRYYGGEASCMICGRYLQPDGRVTKKP